MITETSFSVRSRGKSYSRGNEREPFIKNLYGVKGLSKGGESGQLCSCLGMRNIVNTIYIM